MVVRERAKAEIKPVRLAKSTLLPIKAEMQGEMRIRIAEAADFHKLLGGEVLFVTGKGDTFFFHRDGMLYTTHSFNLNWRKFHRMSINDFGGLQAIMSYKKIIIEEDPKDLAHSAWIAKERAIREQRGGHQILSEQWCAASDFSSRESLEQAVEMGFLSQRDLRSALREGFDNGSVYYFAKNRGFANSNDAKRALSLGIDNLAMFNFVKKGKFEDLLSANEAKARGFTKKKEWDEAVQRGCSSPEELKALKKHGWPTLQAYRNASNHGFRDTESKLYSRFTGTQCFGKIWQAIVTGQRNGRSTVVLEKIRANPKILKEMEISGLEIFWQAAVVLKLRSTPIGEKISLDELQQFAMDQSIPEIPSEKVNADVFREFIYHNPSVHMFGSAVPADGMFECRARGK